MRHILMYTLLSAGAAFKPGMRSDQQTLLGYGGGHYIRLD